MRKLLFLALWPLAACSPDLGIWLLEIDPEGTLECEESLTHNFVNVLEPATEEEEDANWTTEESGSESPELAFVQIEVGAGDMCVMLWDNRILPGTCKGSSWEFTWDSSEVGSSSETHALGYTYSHTYDHKVSTTISLDMSGSSGSGNLDSERATIDSYIESDMWAQAVGVPGGQMPVGNYLKVRGTDESGNVTITPATNTRPNSECAASECTIDANESCTTPSRKVRAVYYQFPEDADYDSVKNNTQSSGYPLASGGGGQQGGGQQGGGQQGGGQQGGGEDTGSSE